MESCLDVFVDLLEIEAEERTRQSLDVCVEI
jgi:hypothetical protein